MRSHKEEYDAVVVGGGPAGCATATHLARAGRAVLLLERAPMGRDKPCGEVFSPPVRGMLQALGALDDVVAAGAANINGATVRCIGGQTFAGGYDARQHSGLCLERTRFDAILWENAVRAGVDARRGVSVCGVLRDGDKRIIGVQTDAGDVRAQIVIGADGGRSRVAREMGVVRPYRHLQKLALVAHFQTNEKTAQEENGSRVEMHVAPNDVVCGFAYGANSVANITFEMPMDAGGGEGGQIAKFGGKEGFARELLRRFPAVAERLDGATLIRVTTCGTFGHGTTTPIADGALLVGDAATFVDPFTGEGVHHALRGAEMAVETISDALRHGDLSARRLRCYARARRAELAPRYFVCDVVQGLVHRRGVFEFLAKKFARRPHLADALVSVTGDLATPYRLLSPGFLFSLATA